MSRPGDASMPRAPRPLAVVRAVFGALLVCFPEFLLRAAPHRQIDHPADAVARVLGARHLLEAALLGRSRSRRWILVSVVIDSIHAVTAVGFAVLDERHRRLALTNGVTAAVFVIDGSLEARRATN